MTFHLDQLTSVTCQPGGPNGSCSEIDFTGTGHITPANATDPAVPALITARIVDTASGSYAELDIKYTLERSNGTSQPEELVATYQEVQGGGKAHVTGTNANCT